MHGPLPRHHMLYGIFTPCNTLAAKPRLPDPPTALLVFDRLKDHAEPSATEAPIGQQRPEFASDLLIIRPIATLARLPGKISFNHVTRSYTLGLSELRNKFRHDLAVALRSCAH